MRPHLQAIASALWAAALSTLGDWIWARFIWIGLAWMVARGLGEPLLPTASVWFRGTMAAIGSGLAFYAISGIWTNPRPGGPDYVYHLVCWTVAFLPGFAALLVRAPAER
jgi:hypothetical protein